MTKPKKKPAPKKGKAGAQTKYNPLYHPHVVYWMANAGLTDEQIAKEFKIVKNTIYAWRRKYPDFDLAMAEGKRAPDERVERSLYQRAVGYSCPEDKIMQYEGKPIIVHTIKHYPPEVVAQIFWLKNRQPDKWRDKHEIDFGEQLDKVVEAFRGIK